jgi:4-amino-4-deoxy-L-arabinose transferase-like glycosyltransferase
VEKGLINKFKFIFILLPTLLVIMIHFSYLLIEQPIQFDSNEYLSIADNIISKAEYSVSKINEKDFPEFKGESPTRLRQPIYPLFLALILFLFKNSINAVLIIQLLISLLILFLVIDIGKRIFQSEYNYYNNLILALYFPLWMLSASILTEIVFTFFITLSIWFYLISFEKNKFNYVLLSGILLGIAFLTRPIALIIFIVTSSLILFKREKIKLKSFGIFTLGFIIIIAPWVLRNYFVLDEFTALSSDGGYNLYSSTLGVNKKPWLDDEGFKSAVLNGYYIDNRANKNFISLSIESIASAPLSYVKNGFLRILSTWSYFAGSRVFQNKMIIFFSFSIVQIFILLFALFGIHKYKKTKNLFLLILPIISFTIIIIFSYSTSRFFIPIMPFVLLLTGQGILSFIEKIKKHNY